MKTLALLCSLCAGCGASLVPDLHLTLTSRRFHVLTDMGVARERWAHGLYASLSLRRAEPAVLQAPRGAPRRLPRLAGRLECVAAETCDWERRAVSAAHHEVTRQLAKGAPR